jgi:hypothetical protein
MRRRIHVGLVTVGPRQGNGHDVVVTVLDGGQRHRAGLAATTAGRGQQQAVGPDCHSWPTGPPEAR